MSDARFVPVERTHRERMLAGDQYIADDPVLRRESDRAALLTQAFGLIEVAIFLHALEDRECWWNVADVDHDLMDLSDPAPFESKTACQQTQRDVAWQLTQRDVVPYRSKRK
jgi:hypothetical protein